MSFKNTQTTSKPSTREARSKRWLARHGYKTYTVPLHPVTHAKLRELRIRFGVRGRDLLRSLLDQILADVETEEDLKQVGIDLGLIDEEGNPIVD